jgi:hypothetical protein
MKNANISEIRDHLSEYLPTVRKGARRLQRSHPLSAADSLQLAAALICCEERPEILGFVCLDERLSDAARREGFAVLP